MSSNAITVSISLPSDLLKNIEQNIAGVSTNDKIIKCLIAGYAILTNTPTLQQK
jgi:metal-responsive CopG/Arc/MetJ family transcriptional regulator